MEVLRHYDYDVPVHAINVLADLKLHRPVGQSGVCGKSGPGNLRLEAAWPQGLGSPDWQTYAASLLLLMADSNRLEIGLWQGHSSHRRHRARMLLGLRHAVRYRLTLLRLAPLKSVSLRSLSLIVAQSKTLTREREQRVPNDGTKPSSSHGRQPIFAPTSVTWLNVAFSNLAPRRSAPLRSSTLSRTRACYA